MLETVPSLAPAAPEATTGPPIFISGCNRGGTTILSHLMASHPDVRSIGKGAFHEGLYIWRKRFHDRSRHRWALPPWRWYLRRTQRHATPRNVEFFHRAFARQVDSPGRMLEKTPANAIRIPFINALYPDCSFVHILRDGRHTTASLIARRVNLLYAPHQWVAAHRIALPDLSALPARRVVIVRHEELVEDPAGTLQEIWDRCGLRLSGCDVDDALDAARRRVVEPENRWEQLSGWKQRYVLSVIRDLQQELGYRVE